VKIKTQEKLQIARVIVGMTILIIIHKIKLLLKKIMMMNHLRLVLEQCHQRRHLVVIKGRLERIVRVDKVVIRRDY
jgi:hypothetical protein